MHIQSVGVLIYQFVTVVGVLLFLGAYYLVELSDTQQVMRGLDEHSQEGSLTKLSQVLLFLLVNAYSDDDKGDSRGIELLLNDGVGSDAATVLPVSETDDVLPPLEVLLAGTHCQSLVETVVEIGLPLRLELVGLLDHVPEVDIPALVPDVEVEVHVAVLVEPHETYPVLGGHELVEEGQDLPDGVQLLVQEVHRLRHVQHEHHVDERGLADALRQILHHLQLLGLLAILHYGAQLGHALLGHLQVRHPILGQTAEKLLGRHLVLLLEHHEEAHIESVLVLQQLELGVDVTPVLQEGVYSHEEVLLVGLPLLHLHLLVLLQTGLHLAQGLLQLLHLYLPSCLVALDHL